MRYIEKIEGVESIYEATTSEEVIDLYNKKNKKCSDKKITIIQFGKIFKNNITIMELEKEIEKSPLRNFTFEVMI